MTEKEKIIASAYTGVQFVNRRKELQEYFNKLLKRNVDLWHISPEIQEELRKASTVDFLDMVKADRLAYYALGVEDKIKSKDIKRRGTMFENIDLEMREDGFVYAVDKNTGKILTAVFSPGEWLSLMEREKPNEDVFADKVAKRVVELLRGEE